MMAASVAIPSFIEGTEIESYLERLDCYFLVSKTDDGERVPILLMGLSPTQYQTLRDLVSPQVPKDVAFDDLVKSLKTHYGKATNQRLERTQFRSITRNEGESILDFQLRIRKAARNCKFGALLEENLLEQFIAGVNHAALTRKLVEKADVKTLAGAMEVASTVQLLEGDMIATNSTATNNDVIARLTSSQQHRKTNTNSKKKKTTSATTTSKDIVCFRCSKAGHRANSESCPALGKTCRDCKKEGHYAGSKYCRSKGKTTPRSSTTNTVQHTPVESASTTATAVDNFSNQFALRNENSYKTPKCQATLGDKTVTFLIDSGAVDNVIDKHTYELLSNGIALQPATKSLYAFGQSSSLPLLGQFTADITVNSHTTNATFYVFDGSACNLMSADTASKLQVIHMRPNMCSVRDVSDDELSNYVKAQYPECFHGVGKLKNAQVKLHIDPECEPVAQPVRRLPFSYRGRVEKALTQLVDEDIIEPVQGVASTWVSPLVVVPKEGDEVRLCVDMRRANTAIVRERYPVPTVQEMLVELNGAQVFSKLDLKQGFFQLELEPGSRDITTFVSHVGLFRMKRLGMGVSAAPEVFQYTVQKILSGLSGVLNMADDIVVFGKDSKEHRERLMQVMARLSECNLTLNPAKCCFGLSSIKFLGHILSKEGVSPDPAKVESILGARRPENVTELKGFLGLVQFVGRYVKGLATVAAPLWELTKQSASFDWLDIHQKSFDKVKSLMGSAQTLAYYDKDAPTTVVADASPVGLGCVLYQVQDGVSRVVAYGHRRLSDVESRYSQIEREALGLMWACEHFKMYLLGTRFRLVTDHKPLVSIFGKPTSKPTPRLERWSLRLQAFDFALEYKPGNSNIADSLSRLSISQDDVVEPLTDDSYICTVASLAVPCAMSWSEIQEAAKSCEDTQAIHKAIQSGDWKSVSAVVRSLRNEFSSCDGVVLRGERIFVPQCLRSRVLSLAHEGHQGIVKTKSRLRLKVWWPGIDKEAENLCRQCMSCQLVGSSVPPTPITPTKLPDSPWKFCSVDLLGPIPDGRSIIIVIDYYSRLFEAGFLGSTKTGKVVSFLENVFARYGYPEMLRSDNGPQFVSSEFQSYLAECSIKWISTTPLWPQANGQVERTNRSVLKTLRIANSEGRNLEQALLEFVVAYKSTPHAATGMTPYALMFGREMRTKLPMFSCEVAKTAAEAEDSDSLYKQRMKDQADVGSRDSPIEQGDSVFLRREVRGKLDTMFHPEPYRVVDVQGTDMTCVGPVGNVVRRHVSVARKVVEPSPSPLLADSPGPVVSTSSHVGQSFPSVSTSPTVHSSSPTSPSSSPTVLSSSPVGLSPSQSLSSSSPSVRVRERRMPVRFKDYQMY